MVSSLRIQRGTRTRRLSYHSAISTSRAADPRIRTPDQRLRVFISSTLGELADERRHARAAVEQLRLTPIMFELGARPHPPRALYRSYLAQSDVFVGIYWQRYGWVAPDMDISGLEDEFVLAAQMPRLIYVKRPAPDMEPRLTEMLQRLEGEDSVSYKPFADGTELHELLVDDLALLLTERFDAPDAAPAAPRSSNLPASTSTFLGREAAIDDLGALLDDGVRLLTLTGPGGTGKTRLAIEAARAELHRFPDGVVFVDVSAERQPDDVFAAVCRALDIGATTETSPLQALQRELAPRQLLLVLDNFEQVTAAGPGVVELLERCPALTVIVTSREALRVSGEHVYPVPPLTVPSDARGDVEIDELLQSEAVRLFAERAAAVGTGFSLTAANAADVAAICRRLDGLPLAVELAAAQVKLFAVDELRRRLDGRADVLKGGARDRPARQQTLRNTIEWSNALLSEDERLVFQLLSVFAPACLSDIETTLGHVASVGDIDVVDAISALVDKNLLRVTSGTDGRPRFSMLQTIRDFACEQLETDRELDAAIRAAHATHYTELALDLHRRLTYSQRAGVLAALGEELGNLRAAWGHWVRVGDVSRLDALFEPAWGYYEARGDYRRMIVLGDDLLRVLSDLPETPERKHDELTLQTNLARTQLAVRGFTPEAERAMLDALARFESTTDERHRFPALRSLATLRLMRTEIAPTIETANELMNIAEKEDDPALLTEAHLLTGISSYWVDDLSVAIAHLDQAIADFDATTSGFVEFRIGPNPGVVVNAVSALLRWRAGLADSAVTRMSRSVQLARDLEHPYSLAYALHHASVFDLWRGDVPSVMVRAEELLELATAHDYPVWEALAMVLGGAAMVASGDASEGLAQIERGFTLYAGLSTPPVFWAHLLMIRSSAHSLAGDLDRAVSLLHEAEASLEAQDPVGADIAIAHGDLLLASTPSDTVGAVAFFERGRTLAAARGARMVELEALTRLVVVHGPHRDGGDVRGQLRALVESFTEGFDTGPVLAARTALGDD